MLYSATTINDCIRFFFLNNLCNGKWNFLAIVSYRLRKNFERLRNYLFVSVHSPSPSFPFHGSSTSLTGRIHIPPFGRQFPIHNNISLKNWLIDVKQLFGALLFSRQPKTYRPVDFSYDFWEKKKKNQGKKQQQKSQINCKYCKRK